MIIPAVVGWAAPHVGWRACFIALAILIALVGLPAAFLIVKRKECASPRDSSEVAYLHPITAWRNGTFRLFYATILLASFCTFIPYVHLVPAARDKGVSLEAGTALISLIGIGNIVGRFVLTGLW